jgi:hypothetical protein
VSTERHPVLSSVAAGVLIGVAFSVYAYFRFAHGSLYGTTVEGVGVAGMIWLSIYQQKRRSVLSEPIPVLRLVTPTSASLMVLGLVFVVFAVLAHDWGFLRMTALLCGTSLALIGIRYVIGRLSPNQRK